MRTPYIGSTSATGDSSYYCNAHLINPLSFLSKNSPPPVGLTIPPLKEFLLKYGNYDLLSFRSYEFN